MSRPELKILIGLHRASNRIDRQSVRIFAKYGLTMGQFAVLEALYHKGDLTVGQVQEKILSSCGTMPVIIRNLETRNYLTRARDDEDKRRSILHITPEGSALMELVCPQNEAKIVELLDMLSDSEKDQLIMLLKKAGGAHDGANR